MRQYSGWSLPHNASFAEGHWQHYAAECSSAVVSFVRGRRSVYGFQAVRYVSRNHRVR